MIMILMKNRDHDQHDHEVQHVARMGEMRNTYKIFVGEPEGKRQLGRPRRRWENNNRQDLTEIGWQVVD
jgi:hypothetical protein